MKTQNENKRQLNCPECNALLNVDELLISQFEESIRKDLQTELQRREIELKNKKDEVQKMFDSVMKEREDVNEIIAKRVREQMDERERNIRETIRKEVNDEKVKQLEELESELARKSSQLVELNQTKAKLQRLSREFEEKEARIHLQMENELSQRLESAKLSMKEQLQMESFLVIKEKETIIESLKKNLEEARQKASQGSMQLQGEAQELVIEETLREMYPNDSIDEIGKGVNGADCIQTVRTKGGIEAGRILYESKNTKQWSDGFIAKLKQDNLTTKADVMVIVTKTMPKDSKGKFVLIDQVWVTTLDNLRDMSLMLRYGLLKTHAVMLTQHNKKDKMGLLYDYLTSEDFKATFESILDGFKNLQSSHNEEQQKLQLLWKRRAKYLEQVLNSTIEFYGSIKSISENSIPTIEMLEIKKAS